MPKTLKREFDYYKTHQSEIVDQYKGRYVVIVGTNVIKDYATQSETIAQSAKQYNLGTFLVQLAENGSDNYTQTFHSMVMLPQALK